MEYKTIICIAIITVVLLPAIFVLGEQVILIGNETALGEIANIGGADCNPEGYDYVLAPIDTMSLYPASFHYILGENATISDAKKLVPLATGGFYVQTGFIEFSNATGDVNIPWLGFKLHIDNINVDIGVIHARLVTPDGVTVAFMNITGGYAFTGTPVPGQTVVVGDVNIKVAGHKGVPYFTVKDSTTKNWIVLPAFGVILANISSASFTVNAVTDEINGHYSDFATAINAKALFNTTKYPVKGAWGIYNVDGVNKYTYIWSKDVFPWFGGAVNAYILGAKDVIYVFNKTYGIGKWNFNETKTIGCDKYLFTSISSVVLVVRGGDNGIYYNLLYGDWIKWSKLSSGSTVDAPAAAVVGGKLHIVVRGRDGKSIWYTQVDLSTGSMSSWTNIPGSTPSRPVLATDGSKLYLLVRGGDNRIYYRVYSGGSWGNWTRLPTGSTVDAPAAAVVGGVLHIVVRGGDGKSLWHAVVDPLTGSMSSWTDIPGSTPSAPYLTTDGSKLYLLVRGGDNKVYCNIYSGGTWTGWKSPSTGSTPATPAGALSGTTLYITVIGGDKRSLYYATMDVNTQKFGQWKQIPGSTPSPPTLTPISCYAIVDLGGS